MPCLRKIPDLIDLQSRYASYVEVRIACDDQPWPQRKKAVRASRTITCAKHKSDQHGVWFEVEAERRCRRSSNQGLSNDDPARPLRP